MRRSKRLGVSPPDLEESTAPTKRRKSRNRKVTIDMEVETVNEHDSLGSKRRKSSKNSSNQEIPNVAEEDVKTSETKSKKNKGIENVADEQITVFHHSSTKRRTSKSNRKGISDLEIFNGDECSKLKSQRTKVGDEETSINHIPSMEVQEKSEDRFTSPRKKKKSGTDGGVNDSNNVENVAAQHITDVDESSSQTTTRKSKRKSLNTKVEEEKVSVRQNPSLEVDANVEDSSKNSPMKKKSGTKVTKGVNDSNNVENVAAQHITAFDEKSQTTTRKSKQKSLKTQFEEEKKSVHHSVEVDENVVNSSKNSHKKKKCGTKDSKQVDGSNNVENVTAQKITAVDDIFSAIKTRKSKRMLLRTKVEDLDKSNRHSPSVEVDENVEASSKSHRKKKGGESKVFEDICNDVPVKQGKKKKNAQTADRVETEDKKKKEKPNVETVENEPSKKKSKKNAQTADSVKAADKKKKEKPNVETVGNEFSKKNSKKNAVVENEDIQNSPFVKSETRKDKKKRNPLHTVEEVEAEDELHDTLVSSNEDAETELGSINSQSSLFKELLSAKTYNSVDLSLRPESWFKNHILSNETEDEVSSEEERMTGVPKTKKSRMICD